MKLVETPEFSVEANPMFENACVFASSIGLRREPETTFSPQMSVWTTQAEKGVPPQDWLTDTIKDGGPIVERKAVAFAGMAGEMIKTKDRLKDWQTSEEQDWYRLRVLLASGDHATWYHAMAMTSGVDLPAIEADFARLLGSIQIKLVGAAASKAREASDEEITTLQAQLKKKIDEEAASNRECAEDLEKAAQAAQAREPVADVATRLDKAIATAKLKDKREALRRIVLPTISLTEIGEAEAGKTGLSRVGGTPDLPQGMDWPRDASGFYLNFLAQINLADLPQRTEPLPKAGLLSFFTGTDYTNWRVLYTPPGTPLVAHTLRGDEIDTTESAFRMVVWNYEQERFLASGTSVGGLSIETDEQARMTFKRNGRTVMVFASEYDWPISAQSLRMERSLAAPFSLPSNDPKAYTDAGIAKEELFDFALAIQESFKVGNGPQHQMFGTYAMSDVQKLAAHYAMRRGWPDIATADGWFILIKLASGGEAGFSFSDHGNYLFMVHRKDAAKGDFSRTFAFVESG